jgi:prepilin-type N-terminal cleavage/methylation domain-containing protein
MHKSHHTSQGFTLIEIIIVIIILSIIISMGGVLLGLGFRGGFASKDDVYVTSMARTAMERMSRDLLSARDASTSDLTPNTNSITYTSNDGNSVTYALSGTNLMRNNKILSKNISALTFTYYDQTFASTTTTSDVRCIQINMTASYNNVSDNLQTLICPRNFSL